MSNSQLFINIDLDDISIATCKLYVAIIYLQITSNQVNPERINRFIINVPTKCLSI